MNAAETAASGIGADLVRRLFVLLKAATVYGPNNEGYRTHSAEARGTLTAALSRADPVRVEVREDRLFFNGAPITLPPGEAGVRFLCAELRRCGAGGLEFRGARAALELDAFVFAFVSGGARRERSLSDTARLLRDAGVNAITPLEPAGEDEGACERARTPEPEFGADAARRAFSRAVDTVEEVMARTRAGQDADLGEAKVAAAELAEQVVADPQALFELSILQRFDEYTYAHCVNVSIYSIAIGDRLGLGTARLAELGFGALFHDLGKAQLPRELIDKPDEFTEDDWRLMRRHPALGARALLALRRPLDAQLARAISIAFEHHLGLDGSGYPKLTPPRRQELFSRICAVADAFDAMTSGRVYAKRAMSPDEALRRMVQRAGTAFDPLLLRVFINIAGVFPIATAVRLDTGERAVVRRNGDDLLRPDVVVLADDGRARAKSSRRAIQRTLDPEENGIDAREVLRRAASASSSVTLEKSR
ncbi:MAG: HD domain-containing protein [Elusimicrobia bacterium]|nr:HD domain-containing protein [Elusimicrobiota bacterium]